MSLLDSTTVAVAQSSTARTAKLFCSGLGMMAATATRRGCLDCCPRGDVQFTCPIYMAMSRANRGQPKTSFSSGIFFFKKDAFVSRLGFLFLLRSLRSRDFVPSSLTKLVNRQGRQERVCFADGRSRNWQHFHTMEIVTEDMGNTTQESRMNTYLQRTLVGIP